MRSLPIFKLIYLHSLMSFFGVLFVGIYFGKLAGISFLMGTFLVGLNWWMLILSWSWLLGKKSIALAGSVIVMKYALFGILCFYLSRQSWIVPSWLVGGVAVIIPATLAYAFVQKT